MVYESERPAYAGASDVNVYYLAADFQTRCTAGGAQQDTFAPEAGPKFVNRPLRMHQDSSQVRNLFDPARGIRDVQKRSGKTPVDHTKNNRKAIQAQSDTNAARKLAEARAAAYGHRKPTAARRASAPGAPQPRMSSSALPGGRDFVHANIVDAGTHRKETAAPGPDGSEYLGKANYGRVPSYLHERNMELAAKFAKQEAAKEAAQVPKGMRIMPDAERLETLDILEANRAEVEQEIQQLPFIIETPSAVKHKNRLLKRLDEIEEAKKIFSRSKVLVKA